MSADINRFLPTPAIRDGGPKRKLLLLTNSDQIPMAKPVSGLVISKG